MASSEAPLCGSHERLKGCRLEAWALCQGPAVEKMSSSSNMSRVLLGGGRGTSSQPCRVKCLRAFPSSSASIRGAIARNFRRAMRNLQGPAFVDDAHALFRLVGRKSSLLVERPPKCFFLCLVVFTFRTMGEVWFSKTGAKLIRDNNYPTPSVSLSQHLIGWRS